jgi:RNA recognition motif-containing protein
VVYFDPKRSNAEASRDQAEAYLRQLEVDRRSVFVGNLDHDITEDTLMTTFSEVGYVVNIHLIRKSNGNDTGMASSSRFPLTLYIRLTGSNK